MKSFELNSGVVVKVMNDKEMSLEVVPFPSEIIRPLVEAKRMAQRKWTDFTCKGYRMKKWTLEIVKEYRSSGKLLTTLDKKLKSEGPKQYLKLLLKEVWLHRPTSIDQKENFLGPAVH